MLYKVLSEKKCRSMPGIARVFERPAHGSESGLEQIIETLLARLTAFATLYIGIKTVLATIV